MDLCLDHAEYRECMQLIHILNSYRKAMLRLPDTDALYLKMLLHEEHLTWILYSKGISEVSLAVVLSRAQWCGHRPTTV